MSKTKLMILPVLAALAGVFIALGPFQDHATSIQLVLVFYALCVWIWRVMVALGVALAIAWALSCIVSFDTAYLSYALLVLGLVFGVVWHVHQRRIEKDKGALEKVA
ncbi:MAG: hypothetical protein JF626_04780 [Polaromonas sp.]|nr:hypothetical protein [Polaromonas sp.]